MTASVTGLAQISLGVSLQLLQDHSADLLGSVLLAVQGHLVVGAHLTLDGRNGVVGVGDSLTLCNLTYQTVAGLGEADNGRGGAGTLRVGDDNGLAALHNSYAAVGSTKVDTNNLTHNEVSSRKNKSCLYDAYDDVKRMLLQTPLREVRLVYSATTTVAWRMILSPSL